MQEQRLGSRYLLADRLGGGGMGEVFLARTGTGERLAVKVLRPELAEDPDLVSRFLQESRLLRRLRHPNVVRVLDMVAEGDRLGIVMEFVPDGDLRRAVPMPCPLPVMLDLLAQVANGLAVIHDAGITHRDLKPENVLVQRLPDGSLRARVADFGVSHRIDSLSTRHNGIVGTAAYLSPESANGMRAGPPGDVYALGVMLYEMHVGLRPFVADSPLAVIRAHAETPIPRPPTMPDPVWELLSAMTAKDPADRPTAGEVSHRMQLLAGSRTLADEPALVQVPGTAEPAVTDPAPLTRWRTGASGDEVEGSSPGAVLTVAGRAVAGTRAAGDTPSTGPISRREVRAGTGSRRDQWWEGRRSLLAALTGLFVLLVLVPVVAVLLRPSGEASGTPAVKPSGPLLAIAAPGAGPVLTTPPAASVTSTRTVTRPPSPSTSASVFPAPSVPTLAVYQPTVSSLEDSDSQAPLVIDSVDPGAGTVASILVRYDTGTQSVRPRSGARGPYHTTVRGLQNGRTYTFTVRVCNSHGKCASSAAVRFTPYTVPTLGPLSARTSVLRVTVTWPALELNGNPRSWTCQLTTDVSLLDRRAPNDLPVAVGGGSITWRLDPFEEYSVRETCTDGTRTVSSPVLTFRALR